MEQCKGCVLRSPFNGLSFMIVCNPETHVNRKAGRQCRWAGPWALGVKPCGPLLAGRALLRRGPACGTARGGQRSWAQGSPGRVQWLGPCKWATGSTSRSARRAGRPRCPSPRRRAGQGTQMALDADRCPHMLVLIRDWLLAGVSSPWLPSRGGDCDGDRTVSPGGAPVRLRLARPLPACAPPLPSP